jgi:hypothetical protein
MKRVVSVSLGSSSRDKAVEATVLGEQFRLERVGTDGDFGRALDLIASLAPKVDCIGLGGIDRYLISGSKRYELRQAAAMARAAGSTPVADGSGFKRWVEPQVLRSLAQAGLLQFEGRKALLMSAVDRPGMAEELPRLGAKAIYGDLIFGLNVPVPLKGLRQLRGLARLVLPVLRVVPISWLYPTGQKQESGAARGAKYFEWADIIAGDFLFIKRYLPESLPGRVIVTNTTTEADVSLLRRTGIAGLATTTPVTEGRSFGTNMWEAILVSLSGKSVEELTEDDYLRFLESIPWKPALRNLQAD